MNHYYYLLLYLIIAFCSIKECTSDVDPEINIRPLILCRQFTNDAVIVNYVTYISDSNVTIPYGTDNKLKIGITAIPTYLYPEDFYKNDDIMLSFPISINFENGFSDFLYHFNSSFNPHGIPLTSPLFSPDTIFLSSSSSLLSWKINGNTTSTAWYDEGSLCCNSLCSYVTPNKECKWFEDEIHIIDYSWTYSSLIVNWNSTGVPWTVFGFVNNYYGMEENGTHIPFDEYDEYHQLSANGFPEYLKDTLNASVHEYGLTFYFPEYFYPSDMIVFCIKANCATDCLILAIDATPSPSNTRSPSMTPSKSKSNTIFITPSISHSISISTTDSPSISGLPSNTPSTSKTSSISISQSITATPSLTSTISLSPTESTSPTISISSSPSNSIAQSISETPSISTSPSVSSTTSNSITPTTTLSISTSTIPSVSSTPSNSITPATSTSTSTSISISTSITPSVSSTPSHSITPTTSTSTSRTKSISLTQSTSITPAISTSTSRTTSISLTKSKSITPTKSRTKSPSKSRKKKWWDDD